MLNCSANKDILKIFKDINKLKCIPKNLKKLKILTKKEN